ncbi:S26 family signal peptidase [Haloarculaceae archaeon H-GB1-1]|nr:S26 family signal peptidase [Haloarculaceae archaeon H-GB1-1]
MTTPESSGDSTSSEQSDPEDRVTFFKAVARDILAVLLVGVLLFAASGVWPPLVAIESQSMTPHMEVGDLVFVMEEHRFPGDAQQAGTGVVTAHAGASADYRKFQNPGDVIVYEPDGNGRQTPIIHRAMFWVEEGENWYDEADQDDIGGADSCDELANCPAPHAGFITKGDANPRYDQVGPSPFSGPVKPGWVVGTAEARVPYLGCVRLASDPHAPRCGILTTAGVAAESVSPVGDDGTGDGETAPRRSETTTASPVLNEPRPALNETRVATP